MKPNMAKVYADAAARVDEREVTVTLRHDEMCAVKAAVNFTRSALGGMPAMLGVVTNEFELLKSGRIDGAFNLGFDAAALGREQP